MLWSYMFTLAVTSHDSRQTWIHFGILKKPDIRLMFEFEKQQIRLGSIVGTIIRASVNCFAPFKLTNPDPFFVFFEFL